VKNKDFFIRKKLQSKDTFVFWKKKSKFKEKYMKNKDKFSLWERNYPWLKRIT
jgi:hypothetical protein